jgi:predicted dehydrogenase
MVEQTYNVAVIGYGLSARVFMIPFLNTSRLKLYAIVQRTPTPDNDAKHDHPDIMVYRSSEEMLEDQEIDIVIVASPPRTHFTLCAQALEAGKHGMSL